MMLMQHPPCARFFVLWMHARMDTLTESYVEAASEPLLAGELDTRGKRELDAEYLENLAAILSAAARLAKAAGFAQRYFDELPPELLVDMVNLDLEKWRAVETA